MIKLVNVVEYLFLSVGLVISVSDINNILCVILLILDSIWLIIKVAFKIAKAIADGKLTDEEIEDIENDLDKKGK